MFATCSDDTTIALWDIRCLRDRLKTFNGHSRWVKNVELSPDRQRLVTSAFDGAVYLWDINRYSDTGEDSNFKKLLSTSGLMRMRLSPLGDRMVVSTMNGFIIVIHDLNLDTIQEDLKSFKVTERKLIDSIAFTYHYSIFFSQTCIV